MKINQIFMRVFLLSLIVVFPSICFSQSENKELSKSSSPESLKKERSSLETDISELKAKLKTYQDDLSQIEFLEIDAVSKYEGKFGSVDKDLDLIQNIDTSNIEESRSELKRRAELDILEAMGQSSLSLFEESNDFDVQSYRSLVAGRAALAIQRAFNQETTPPDTPKECDGNSQINSDASESDIKNAVSSCIRAVGNIINSIVAIDVPSQVSKILDPVKKELQSKIQLTRSQLIEKEENLSKVIELIGNSEDLTETIVKWTIPALGILLVIIFLGPRLYGGEMQKEIFATRIVLELLTVYILVSSILILGLANRIDNEVLGTLLGGISGYVLGRSFSGGVSRQTKDE
ncbi:hypothetical protein D515_04282 [Grimontia indica]|uniref:Uncharacterized protein n=2 Tax=Grimontia indica TaxID=1056512 RepID=R1J199_9GAMM|nr:hypothetical protein D515_04282 [Grimontia indica]